MKASQQGEKRGRVARAEGSRVSGAARRQLCSIGQSEARGPVPGTTLSLLRVP